MAARWGRLGQGRPAVQVGEALRRQTFEHMSDVAREIEPRVPGIVDRVHGPVRAEAHDEWFEQARRAV